MKVRLEVVVLTSQQIVVQVLDLGVYHHLDRDGIPCQVVRLLLLILAIAVARIKWFMDFLVVFAEVC